MRTATCSVLKGFLWALLILGLLVSMLGFVRPGRAQVSDPPPDQVAVKLKATALISTILGRYNAALLATMPENRVYVIQLLGGQTAQAVLPAMSTDSDIIAAEPNYYAGTAPDGSVIYIKGTMAPLAGVIYIKGTGELTPTPTGGPDQWAWLRTGLADAQKISRGQGIIVAVLDTGLAADHPLLSSSLTTGFDFVSRMDNSIYDTGNGVDDDGDGLIDEDLGHGTHVAGIIVTEAPGVQIMPVRVLNSDGVGTYWEVAQGIRYAVDHGAKIINMSLSAPRLTPSLSDALVYAAARGVIVVAAAGTGLGPNYPAGYGDRLAVLGVGASDRNDAVAWFSGGLALDTDVFAPGVDINSAFPYSGYALGSGTSMAAPMVAGEAAMLWSRHPDWSASEIVQRILSQTDPVSGSAARRVHLGRALTTGLEVDHANPDLTARADDDVILPRLRLFNNTPQDIPLNELTIRYWYTLGPYHPQTFLCDYSTPIACANITGQFVSIPLYTPNRTSLSDTYLEIGFLSSAGNLVAGGQVEAYLHAFKDDLTNYNEWNDYSYDDPARPDMTRWNRITVYRNGLLAWGVEPAAGILTPSPTWARSATLSNTSAAASASPTRTNSPAPASPTPSRTATRTRTPTRLPSRTSSPTRTLAPASLTPTRSSTSMPTPTRTNPPPTSPAASCAVTYTIQNDWGTGFTGYVVITNTGSSSINGWTLEWSFPGNQAIYGMWNGSYTQNGQTVAVTNLEYNAAINPNGGSVNFGFNASYSGANAKPVGSQLNGVSCVGP